MKTLLSLLILISVQVCDAADSKSYYLSYGYGDLSLKGDVAGVVPKVSNLSAGVDYRKPKYSSTYEISYLTNGSPSFTAVKVEKGYFYYLLQPNLKLKEKFGVRLGGKFGVGRFDLGDLTLKNIRYQKASSFILSGSAGLETTYRINGTSQFSAGVSYSGFVGTQEIIVEASQVQLGVTLSKGF